MRCEEDRPCTSRDLQLLHITLNSIMVDLDVNVIEQLYKEEASLITVQADGGPRY